MMDDKYNVSDSTDWKETSIPLLAPLDANLRCQVCKDFFDAAVVTQCAHTFCSRCIRRAISADGHCPACRTSVMEHHLRRNVAVQEIVDAFQVARPQALEVARKRSEEARNGALNTRGAKRKRAEVDGRSTSQGPRTRSQRKRSRPSPPEENYMIIDDSEEGEEEEEENEPRVEEETEREDDGLVPCPICNTRMKEDAVFPHLDKCDGSQEEQRPQRRVSRPAGTQSHSATPVVAVKPPPERLAQLNYSLMKEKDLRKKLSDLEIPNWGSKELIIRRHKEWVNICNSNLDSLRPRAKRNLLTDLDTWERTHGGNASQRGGFNAANSNVMSKDFDGASWAKQNKTDFDALIANARKGRVKAAAASDKELETEQSTPAVKSTSHLSITSPGEAHSEPISSSSGQQHANQPPALLAESPKLLPELPSLTSPLDRPLADSSRIPYRRPSNASPVPGFSLPAPSPIDLSMPPPSSAFKSPPTLHTSVSAPTVPTPSPIASLHSRIPSENSIEALPSLQRSDSADSQSSLPGRLAEQGLNVRKKHMFEVPSDPVVDAEFSTH